MYNYLENIKSDILDYVKEEREYLKDMTKTNLIETLENEDAITGNMSGSYYCNTWKAEESLNHNWNLLKEALEAFCYEGIDILEKGAEWCDVIIRCYLVSQAFEEVEDEVMEILESEEV